MLLLRIILLFSLLAGSVSARLYWVFFEDDASRPKVQLTEKAYERLVKRGAPNVQGDRTVSPDHLAKIRVAGYRISTVSRFLNAASIEIEGQDILDKIKKFNKQVVFISGHFANFELMALHLEKSGIPLSTIYRPLNNIFLNKIMERIRNKYICEKQIKKGIGGMKKLIKLKKDNYSTALMIDQRVSEGIKSNFFNKEAFTTTIPAQLAKKFKIPVVPICIERIDNINFKIIIKEPISFTEEDSIKKITDELNIILEKMILQKPGQWIWSHNRWK